MTQFLSDFVNFYVPLKLLNCLKLLELLKLLKLCFFETIKKKQNEIFFGSDRHKRCIILYKLCKLHRFQCKICIIMHFTIRFSILLHQHCTKLCNVCVGQTQFLSNFVNFYVPLKLLKLLKLLDIIIKIN